MHATVMALFASYPAAQLQLVLPSVKGFAIFGCMRLYINPEVV